MNEKIYTIPKFIFFPKGVQKFYFFLMIAFLMFLCTLLVYQTGGTQFSYLHIFYLPIILASLSFSVCGGVITAIVASVILGPWMPVNVEHNIPQPVDSILIRSLFFVLVGILSGFGAKIFRDYLLDLERRLTTDTVTGLPNIRGISQLVHAQPESPLLSKYAVVIIMVGHLKEIINGLGHETVEHLLQHLSKLIAPSIKQYGCLGHLDAENFCVVVYKDTDAPRVVEICRQLLKPDIIVDQIPIFVEFAYGIAFRYDYSEPLHIVIRKAKLAAERSYRNSTCYKVFDQKDDVTIERNIEIIRDLHKAISSKSIYLHYQPTIHLKTLEIVGVEALARWDHPKYGLIPPDEFFPLLEGTSLINNYTKWLVESALTQLSAWHAEDIHISLALNFSMKNFFDAELIDHLFQTVKRLNVSKKYVTIEVTETSVAENILEVADILSMLRQSGFRIAVDDFGTGHSSLQYLFELPLDIIKIDKSFIKACSKNSAAEAIIRSAIFLAKELKLVTVAEGIENKEDYLKLRTLGCNIGQGYYFARPIPAQLVKEWIKSKYIQNNFQVIKS